MFNRGTKPDQFGGRVEELIGDRDSKVNEGLSALEGNRSWDVVIDNSGYVPRHVRDSVKLLKDRCKRYLYISTVAVYDFDDAEIFPEDARLAQMDDPTLEEVNGETYGPLKALCDAFVQEELGSQATIVRPTYVVGPGDHTDRFTYWVDRVYRGGDVLAPGGPALNAQWVDAQDLCPWVITLAENDTPGVFNAAGPSSTVTREGLMWGLRAMTDQPVRFHWPTMELLEELEIETPMMSQNNNYERFENSASMAAGLKYRALADTASQLMAWWLAQPEERRANPRRWPDEAKVKQALARMGV
jgi:2'-hydroxyisoflavone reductase